jgi:hypothetical protein
MVAHKFGLYIHPFLDGWFVVSEGNYFDGKSFAISAANQFCTPCTILL